MLKMSVFVIVHKLNLNCIIIPQSNDINLSIVPGIEIQLDSLSLKIEKIYTPGYLLNLKRKICLPAVPIFLLLEVSDYQT